MYIHTIYIIERERDYKNWNDKYVEFNAIH